MTAATLKAPVVDQKFPAGTIDAPFDYTVTGTLADGVTPFTHTQQTGAFDLPPGLFRRTSARRCLARIE